MEIQLEAVQNGSDLMALLRNLMEEYEGNPENWNNTNVYAFLDAMHGYMSTKGLTLAVPSWALFAEILYGATNYE